MLLEAGYESSKTPAISSALCLQFTTMRPQILFQPPCLHVPTVDPNPPETLSSGNQINFYHSGVYHSSRRVTNMVSDEPAHTWMNSGQE